MKATKILLIVLVSIVITVILGITISSYIKMITKQPVKVGVFDPSGSFAKSDIQIEHVFLSWTDSPEKIRENINPIIEKNRLPLITLEPWPYDSEWKARKDSLLSDISAGYYDKLIDKTCSEFRKSNHEIWIRWGHEMELGNSVYPWQKNNPKAFVDAYKHFVTVCKNSGGRNNKFMWSPGGDEGAEKYWPGDEYVDYVGLTGLNISNSIQFKHFFQEKYSRVAIFDKPIVIAEFGVLGDTPKQRKWIQKAFDQFSEFPLLIGVVYFNAQTPVIWDSTLPVKPDWRISPDIFPPQKG